MKTLLTLFVLLFSSSVFADDISDFEIERVSIWDSALEHLSEEEIFEQIEANKEDYEFLKDPYKFVELKIYNLNNKEFTNYDFMSFFIKTDSVNKYLTNKNEKFKIYAIRGMIRYNGDLDGCIKKRNEIEDALSQMFKNAKKTETEFNHSADPSGNSKIYQTIYKLESMNEASIDCMDFEETFRNKRGWSEGLSVGISTVEWDNWIRNK